MKMAKHIDSHYEAELKRLSESLLKMGGLVEEMIARAMRSLVERDSNAANEVLKKDEEVNRLEVEIDGLCIQILALRQPTASDLRFVTIGLRASKDLERMGDLAVNIAEQAIALNREPQLKPYVDLPAMASQTEIMVKKGLDAFVQRNAELAQQVCKTDDAVDSLNDKIFDELLALMQKDPTAVVRSTRLILVSRHLERIADHATNIAEEVIFMVQGRDIRHGRGKKEE